MCLAEGHNTVTPVRTNNLDPGQARRSIWPESVSKLHKLSTDDTRGYIWESPSKFDNRIMARMYETRITRSTMYQKLHFASQNWRMEN